MSLYDIAIIGGGPAGSTAAIYTARAGFQTVVLDKSIASGALGLASLIANYPGITDPISGVELLQRMRQQAESFGAQFLKHRVVGVDFSGGEKRIFTADAEVVTAKAVILATGAMGRSSTLPGEQEFLGRGVSYCAICDAAFFKGKTVLVYGSDPFAIEESEILSRFASNVCFVCTQKELPGTLPSKVQAYWDSRLTEITGNSNVTGATLATPTGPVQLAVDGVFIYMGGNKPVVDYLYGGVETSDHACILVDREYRTNMPGVFACGDVLCNDVQQVAVAVGQGCIAALSADKYLRGKIAFRKDYQR